MALVSIFIIIIIYLFISGHLLYETREIKNDILNNNLFDLSRYSARHYHANVIIFFCPFYQGSKTYLCRSLK